MWSFGIPAIGLHKGGEGMTKRDSIVTTVELDGRYGR